MVQLEKSYLMIVRIQMTFIGTIGVVLIGFPNLILHLFNSELEQFSNYFTMTATCLLLISGIGPVTGMLQMTGNEIICNRNQWISICFMMVICIAFNKDPLFAVYGLCAQAVLESSLKYIAVCRWFGKNIVPIKNYLLLWLPVGLIRFAVDKFNLQYSILALICFVILVFIWNAIFAINDPMIHESVTKLLKKNNR